MSAVQVSLVLGPLLRYVDQTTATVWVETSGPASVQVLGSRAETFTVEDHHYALVVVDGLESGAEVPYSVALDGITVWPEPGDPRPAPRIRTMDEDRELDVMFGSCRIDRPSVKPWNLPHGEHSEAVGVDALVALSRALQAGERRRPDLMLLLGDQVYADKRTSPQVQDRLSRQDPQGSAPQGAASTFEEYTWVYQNSWSQAEVRWLLATVPSAMIFDDHEVRDNWNISAAWRNEVTGSPEWEEQVTGAYMAYWLYQHAGNLSPDDLLEEGLWPALTASSDGESRLREFARHADEEVDGRKRSQWSYRRELGKSRLVVLDTRSGRILETGRRSMLSDAEWDLVQQWLRQDCEHLVIASSLPVLLERGVHDFEAWNEALCAGAWGSWVARWSERLRRTGNLEQWAAFQHSFHRLAETVIDIAAGRHGQAPSTVLMLSGDVHHSYVARQKPSAGRNGHAPVVQLVSSPLRNQLTGPVRWLFTIADSTPARVLGRLLTRTSGVSQPPADWSVTTGPLFGNFLAWVHLSPQQVQLGLEQAWPVEGRPVLDPVHQQTVVGVRRSS